MADERQESSMDQEQAETEINQESQQQQPGQAQPSLGGPTQDQYDELNHRYLRLAADFDNYRKRQAQEREHLFKYGAQNTLESLLPVLDNLDRAKQSLNENSDPKVLMQSFDLLAQQLLGELKNIGLEKMHPKGEIFNPELHEAISQVENPDVPDHTIIDVYKDGYTLHDRVLRPAQVVVAVNPQPSSKSQESGQAASNDEFAPQQPRKDKNPFQQTTP